MQVSFQRPLLCKLVIKCSVTGVAQDIQTLRSRTTILYLILTLHSVILTFISNLLLSFFADFNQLRQKTEEESL